MQLTTVVYIISILPRAQSWQLTSKRNCCLCSQKSYRGFSTLKQLHGPKHSDDEPGSSLCGVQALKYTNCQISLQEGSISDHPIWQDIWKCKWRHHRVHPESTGERAMEGPEGSCPPLQLESPLLQVWHPCTRAFSHCLNLYLVAADRFPPGILC